MGGSVNRALIVGNLGADPEVRDLPNGQKVANLRVATNERWTDRKSGETKERTEWHSVSVFDQSAVRYAEQYLRKSARVYVEGRVQTRKWQDKSGTERYITEIVVNSIGGKLLGLSVPGELDVDRPPSGIGPSNPDINDIGDIPF